MDCFQSRCNVFQMGMMRGQGIKKRNSCLEKQLKGENLKRHTAEEDEKAKKESSFCVIQQL